MGEENVCVCVCVCVFKETKVKKKLIQQKRIQLNVLIRYFYHG